MRLLQGWLAKPLLVGSVLLYASQAVADQANTGLRGTLANDLPLTHHIVDASNWGIRKTRRELLASSLLYSSAGQSFDNYSLRGETIEGQPIEVYGLRGFVTEALNRSDALRGSLHQANAARLAARAQLYEMLPTLSVNADIAHEIAVVRQVGIDREGTERSASLTANWTIFSSGANWYAYKSAQSQARAADLQFLADERQVFFQSVGVYLQLVGGYRQVEAIEGTVRRLREIRHSVQRQFEAGLTSRSDVAQVDAEIDSVKVQLEQAKLSLEQQRIAYADLTGRQAHGAPPMPDVAALIPPSKEEALRRALIGNPTIEAAYHSSRAAEQESKAVRGQFLPQVSLFGTGTFEEINNDWNRSDDYEWRFGASLTVPLVNFTAMPRYRSARQQAKAAYYQSRDTERQVRLEIETSWTQYQSMLAQAQTYGNRAAAIKRVLVGLRKQYDAGLIPIDDVLRQEIAYTENEIQRARADLESKAFAYRLLIQFSDISLDTVAPI